MKICLFTKNNFNKITKDTIDELIEKTSFEEAYIYAEKNIYAKYDNVINDNLDKIKTITFVNKEKNLIKLTEKFVKSFPCNGEIHSNGKYTFKNGSTYEGTMEKL